MSAPSQPPDSEAERLLQRALAVLKAPAGLSPEIAADRKQFRKFLDDADARVDSLCADIRAHLRRPAAREPEGQWVPKEPTEAMCDAGMDMLLGDCNLMDADCGGTIRIQTTAPRDLWQAMLRASEPTEGGA